MQNSRSLPFACPGIPFKLATEVRTDLVHAENVNHNTTDKTNKSHTLSPDTAIVFLTFTDSTVSLFIITDVSSLSV